MINNDINFVSTQNRACKICPYINNNVNVNHILIL